MAEKRFAGVDGSVDAPEVTADFDSAQVFERLRVGELGVYFRDGLKTRFIPYAYIDRAFIRVQETRSRMCCGRRKKREERKDRTPCTVLSDRKHYFQLQSSL